MDRINTEGKLNQEQIDQCISILERLNTDTDLIYDIPKDRRIELFMQAGKLSRPQKDELNRRKKMAKKMAKKAASDQDK